MSEWILRPDLEAVIGLDLFNEICKFGTLVIETDSEWVAIGECSVREIRLQCGDERIIGGIEFTPDDVSSAFFMKELRVAQKLAKSLLDALKVKFCV